MGRNYIGRFSYPALFGTRIQRSISSEFNSKGTEEEGKAERFRGPRRGSRIRDSLTIKRKPYSISKLG